MLAAVPDVPAALPAGGPSPSLLDQIVREGARQMLAAALQAEVAAYVGQFTGVRDENGRRLVVRNGSAGPRTVLTRAGAVEVPAPRVNDKRTDPATEELLAFCDYPAGHWVHLRTTNPIESTLVTVRHRTKVTTGHRSRAAGLAMACKLTESAQRSWRTVNAPHLVALVRAGATFINGQLAERTDHRHAAELPTGAAA